ncbi:SlyX family protein [Thalassospira lucentensis]|uniref:SlyX family protein n=1 Tax=Thalassospira lucentensis TaxID=168935 RepID=UPI003D2BCEEC
MSHNDAESRITDLETKMAHMDTMINDLSDMIKSQWDRIDILERRNRLMSDDVKRMGDLMRTSSEDDVPPPHY